MGAAIFGAFVLGRVTAPTTVAAPAPSAPVHAATLDMNAAPLTMPVGSAYVAARGRTVFHLPGCEWADKIGVSNRATFATRDAAIAAGYRPCRVCGP